MSSFNTALDELVTLLQYNPGLVALCEQYWSKQLTILRVFRNRTEVLLTDLPLVMVTRYQLDPGYQENSVYGGHKLRLYYGFHQDDRLKAQVQTVAFEEALRDALLVDPSTNGTTENVTPGTAVNDEGQNHPVYFGVMEVDVMHKR
ncbi:MAG TPA: hypothetical protein DCS05_04240 [Nitrospiraceae bacterium]|nr:hypothetical protein [Nitrospiraceae bacterium]